MDPRNSSPSTVPTQLVDFLASLEAGVAVAMSAIQEHARTLENFEGQIDDLASRDDLDHLERKVNDLSSDLENLDIPDTADIEDRITALEERDPAHLADSMLQQGREISDLNASQANLLERVNSLTETIGLLSIAINNIRQDIATLADQTDKRLTKLGVAWDDMRTDQGAFAISLANLERNTPADTIALLSKLVEYSHRSADVLNAMLQEMRNWRP